MKTTFAHMLKTFPSLLRLNHSIWLNRRNVRFAPPANPGGSIFASPRCR
jgi:hypothetical protein